MMENIWVNLIDIATYLIALIITFLLYRLYRRIFIRGYVRKFEEALSSQDDQRVEYMLLDAKHKQPRKIYPIIHELKRKKEELAENQ